MKDNKTSKRLPGSKSEKKEMKLFVLFLVIVIFLPIAIFGAMDWFVNSDTFTIGITGFIQTVIVNGCLGLLAIIIALVFVVKLIQPDTSFKQKFGRTVVIILCTIAAFFLIRPLILDISYLKCPETTYLDRLEFDDEMGVGDNPTRYYLRGVDITGERQSFNISERLLKEGRELWSKNEFNLFAKVSYLPHTSTLMTLEFITKLDASTADLYPPSAALPDNWNSFSIQINSNVYTLPVPLTTFINDGWKISEDDAGLYLAGADEPNASYEWEWISLTNDDFSGTELRLPGGMMLGWSTKETVLDLYGQPDDSFESTYGDYILTYETDDPIDKAYWRLGFDDHGILDDVMLHHQAYFRYD